MNKQIKEIASIYIILILTIWLCYNNYEISKQLQSLKDEVIEVKKVAIELNQDNSNYSIMLNSMNKYADELESDLREYRYLEKLKKDLSQHTNKRLVIALCYPENTFNYNRSHKDKNIIGKVCGIKKLWIEEIPELNKNNINTLKGGEIVINYLINKNNGNLFEAIKDFKGSKTNIYPVKETIKIYRELK
jgi:hypothetical protein